MTDLVVDHILPMEPPSPSQWNGSAYPARLVEHRVGDPCRRTTGCCRTSTGIHGHRTVVGDTSEIRSGFPLSIRTSTNCGLWVQPLGLVNVWSTIWANALSLYIVDQDRSRLDGTYLNTDGASLTDAWEVVPGTTRQVLSPAR